VVRRVQTIGWWSVASVLKDQFLSYSYSARRGGRYSYSIPATLEYEHDAHIAGQM
jgi:hypothetical protein